MYVTVGSMYIAKAVSINYEHVLSTKENGNQLRIKLNGGIVTSFYDSKDDSPPGYATISIVPLFGKNGHFFELDLGGGFAFIETVSTVLVPYLSLGYRRQFDKILFRAGVSFPEMIYVSLGFRL